MPRHVNFKVTELFMDVGAEPVYLFTGTTHVLVLSAIQIIKMQVVTESVDLYRQNARIGITENEKIF
jgi:hypothetical protein